ncbi:hypothetical protein NERG_01632 [Nematocida ausubeli]|uniref:ERCC1-like central domain-containing protein n=1 Tax=Nematocida ausubeli (strain ATCC PRA-371 / ERTm2) TaxID=1913371 RepID=H8ZDG1_NEMA1|nr:hypothetical protein NERG_01632 [Nematocida ausubeli]
MKSNELQRGNALIKYIKKTPIEYKYTVFDYEPGEYFGVLHITLQLHMSSPQYIFGRIERIKSSNSKRVPIIILLLSADITSASAASAFTTLQIDCMATGVRIIPAYSPVECAKYIETMHFQKSEASHLRNYRAMLEKTKKELSSRPSEVDAQKLLFLAAIPKVTKRDSAAILAGRSLREIAQSAVNECTVKEKGIGVTKKNAMKDFFMQKFN